MPIEYFHAVKIVSNTPDRLELRGVPGGRGVMAACTLIGAAIVTVVLSFAIGLYREQGWGMPHLPMALGVVIGVAVFATGAVTLAVARERLVFDRAEGKGWYESRSPIVVVPKPFSFTLSAVDSVMLDFKSESRPGHAGGHATTAQVCTAKLRVSKPRRSVMLDETENGREDRVRTIAQAVSSFLEIPLIERGGSRR